MGKGKGRDAGKPARVVRRAQETRAKGKAAAELEPVRARLSKSAWGRRALESASEGDLSWLRDNWE